MGQNLHPKGRRPQVRQGKGMTPWVISLDTEVGRRRREEYVSATREEGPRIKISLRKGRTLIMIRMVGAKQ